MEAPHVMGHRAGRSDRTASVGRDGESGETLVEALVSLVVIMLAVLALVAALGASVRISDQSWRASRGAVRTTSLSESALALTYVPCTAGDSGASGPATTYRNALTVPSGMALTVTGAYLTSTAPPANSTTPATATFGTCPASDLGAQQLTLTLRYTTTNNVVVPPIVIIKRNTTCSAKAIARSGYLAGQQC